VVLDDAGAASATAVFRLLSDATRLALVWHLRGGEHSVNELAQLVDRPAPAVSQHLARLRLSQLVGTRKDGTTVYYRLESSHVGRLVVDALSHAQHTRAGASA
jgi:ArsR family transcriptional regulator, zinc-responsive transcriptional repressor